MRRGCCTAGPGCRAIQPPTRDGPTRWIEVHFNPAAFVERSTFVYSPIVYLNWIALLAVAKLVLGSHWMTGIIALNWVTIVVTAAALFTAVRGLTRCGPSVLMAALLFLSAFDILLFVPFVLSDVVFLGLSTAVLLTGLWLVRVSEEDTGRWRRWRLLTVGDCTLLIAGLTRPTVLPLLGYWLLAIGLSWRLRSESEMAGGGRHRPGAGRDARHRSPCRFHDGARELAVSRRRRLDQAAERRISRRDGRLRQARDERTPPSQYVDFVALTLHKWLYYFAPVMSDYSRLHVFMNALFFGTATCSRCCAGKVAESSDRDAARSVTIGFSLFHAMQQIDYDFRYRLPALPALIIGAALGLAVLLPRPGLPQESCAPDVRLPD